MRQHGTRNRYLRGPDATDTVGKGCRCDACVAKNSEYAAAYRRLRAYGRWSPFVDPGPARRHVAMLGELGIKPQQIAEMAGLGHQLIAHLMRGQPRLGLPPTQRIRASTEQAILAVQASPAQLKDGAHVDGAGTRRRLQALIAMGWTRRELSARLGFSVQNLSELTRSRADGVRAGTARKVAALYEQLWDQPPPEGDPAARRAASRTRSTARKQGWPPPAAWDDDLIDLPAERLAAELKARSAAMTTAQARACHNARYRLGDTSPLIVAGAAEYERRKQVRRAEHAA